MWGDLGWQRLGLTTALVSIAYYLGAQIGFVLTFPSLPTSIFWLPNATMLGVFLLARPRNWWVYVLAALPAHFAVQLQHNAPHSAMVLLFFTNVGDALLAAAAMRTLSGGEPIFDNFRNVLIFVGVAIASPLLVSFVDAGIVVATGWGHDYWLIWYTRFCSNALTNLIWVPVMVIGLTRGLDSLRATDWRRCTEAALLALGLAVVAAAFGVAGMKSNLLIALLYAPLPLLLWGSARFGVGGEAAALLVFAFLVVWNAIHGNGPFASDRPNHSVFAMQVFLTALAVPMMLIASLWADRRRRESALRDRQAQYERAREVAAYEERRRLARDLHDSVTQSLSASVMMAEILPDVWQRDPEEGRRTLATLRQTTTSALSELRSLVQELRQGALTELSLVDLLRRLTAAFRDRGKACMALELDETANVPPGVDIAFFRVAQEALNNVIKHSAAHNVRVVLYSADDGASLTIRDDGIGFERTTYSSRHLGLRIMDERTAAVGALLRIDSAPGRGTTVTVTWSQSRPRERSGPIPLGGGA